MLLVLTWKRLPPRSPLRRRSFETTTDISSGLWSSGPLFQTRLWWNRKWRLEPVNFHVHVSVCPAVYVRSRPPAATSSPHHLLLLFQAPSVGRSHSSTYRKCMYIAGLCSCVSVQLLSRGIGCFLSVYYFLFFLFFFKRLLLNFLDHCGKFDLYSDILFYVLIERERFGSSFSQHRPYGGALRPFFYRPCYPWF